jgi:hypothetical protein
MDQILDRARQHFVQRLDTPRKRTFFLALWTLSVIICLVALNIQGAPLQTPPSPMGIVSFQLAASLDNALNIRTTWAQSGVEQRAFSNILLDFLFICWYVPWLVWICWWAKRPSVPERPEDEFVQRTGKLFAQLMILAGVLNAVGDICQLVMLKSAVIPLLCTWISLAANFLKFLLLGLGLLYFCTCWEWLIELRRRALPWLPTILAIVCPIALVFVLYTNRIGQLSDITSPATAHEDGGNFGYLLWGADWLVVFICFVLSARNVWKLNQNVGQEEPPPAPAGKFHRAVHAVASKMTSDQCKASYLDLIVRNWAIVTICPVVFSVLFYLTGGVAHGDVHAPALACTLSLLTLLGASLAVWILGYYLKLGLLLPFLAWTPAAVLVLGLFSAWLPDAGKQIWNGPRSLPAEKRNQRVQTLRFWDRKDMKADNAPLVILCVSGGGSRAALFTAGILNRMWWQEASAASQSNPAAGSTPPPTERYPGRALLLAARAISSVSGGSLASAYFVQRLSRLTTGTQDRTPALNSVFEPPIPNSFFDQNQIPAQDQLLAQFEQNAYIHDMGQDFLGATITGFFLPLIGRGPGLQAFWDARFGWNERPLENFAPAEIEGQLPSLVINSTLTETGSRLAITNLSLDNFYSRNYHAAISWYKFGLEGSFEDLRPDVTNRYDPLPGRMDTLNEMDPTWAIPLSLAVRASANVPYAFPAIQFIQRNPDGSVYTYKDAQGRDTGGDAIHELYDGGVLDNTGLDSAMALLRQLAARNKLAKRKVLIFLIDSGLVPLDPNLQSFSGLLPNLSQAQNALTRSDMDMEPLVEALYVKELAALCGETQSLYRVTFPDGRKHKTFAVGFEGKHCAIFMARPGETSKQIVMTSWHLPVQQRAELYSLICEPQQGKAILEAANWLKEKSQ